MTSRCSSARRCLGVPSGKGGATVCPIDLDERFREARYLLHGILHYAAGERFAPTLRLTEEMMGRLVEATGV